jgi:hypothetical protein
MSRTSTLTNAKTLPDERINRLQTSNLWLIRQADAARRLKCSRARIAQMIAEGKLAVIALNGVKMITNESLRVWEAALPAKKE